MNKLIPWIFKYRHAYESGIIDIHEFGRFLRFINNMEEEDVMDKLNSTFR